MTEKSATALRTIGEVADELGIATHVLRFWESKFHQIKPQKRRGRRYYRPEDVDVIVHIKELLYGKGYTIRGVQKFLSEEVRRKSEQVTGDVHAKQASAPVTPTAITQLRQAPPQQGGVTTFKTDVFGNIIPATPAALPLAQQQSVPLVQSAAKPAFNTEDLARLRKVYDGLVDISKELQDVA